MIILSFARKREIKDGRQGARQLLHPSFEILSANSYDTELL